MEPFLISALINFETTFWYNQANFITLTDLFEKYVEFFIEYKTGG